MLEFRHSWKIEENSFKMRLTSTQTVALVTVFEPSGLEVEVNSMRGSLKLHFTSTTTILPGSVAPGSLRIAKSCGQVVSEDFRYWDKTP
jgi:hypothetical protein